MVADGPLNVLISEPQLPEMGLPYLPIMWGVLKTHWEHSQTDSEMVTWLPPIHHMGAVSSLLRPYGDSTIDVLGLSCYTWNWPIQCLIAQEVKRRNPACVVVAGGPEPDYKDPSFFSKHGEIDLVAIQDGEITFSSILQTLGRHTDRDSLLEDPDSFSHIPGLYLRDRDLDTSRFTGPPHLPQCFDVSPYIEQSAYYEALLRQYSPNVIAVWETNRGCPYSCSFCDWGSNTMSRVRVFNMDRILAESDWFGRCKVGFVMLCDANFGILPRDLEIANLLTATNQRYGYPNYVSYNTAKNNANRTVAIAKTFFGSGLNSAHVLSIQHTDPAVLAATNRSNISVDKQLTVVRELLFDGIPIYVQLILGIPGDRYESWKRCFSDLMEWGIHSYYWVFPYNLLPNAPAGEASYKEEWAIETLDRYVVSNHGARARGPFDPVAEAASRLVVSSRTFSRSDWIRMNVYASCVRALHCSAVTQRIAFYLRLSHQVPYQDFYDRVIDGFFPHAEPTRAWWKAMKMHYEHYLRAEDAVDFMDVPQLPGFTYQMEPSRWLFIQICYDVDDFYDALRLFLVEQYPEIPTIGSIVDYQRNILVLPYYERGRGKSFETDRDWPAYFQETETSVACSALSDPPPRHGMVLVRDTARTDERITLPMDWCDAPSEDARWERWIHTTVVGRNSTYKNNFQQLEFREHEERPESASRDAKRGREAGAELRVATSPMMR